MKKILALVLVTLIVMAMAFGCTAPSGTDQTPPVDQTQTPANTEQPSTEEPAAEAYKVALLLTGSANDNSWNQFGYDALLNAQKAIGEDKIEIAYSENLAAIDIAPALRDYASKGYDLIVGHSGSFEDDMLKVGAEFPETEFVVVCGSYGGEVGSNVTAVDIAACQQGFSYGYLAAKASKSGKVGFVGFLQGVQVMNNVVGGFKDGAKTANPDVTVTIVYLKDGNDVAEGREAALALAAAGCDVIMHELNAASGGVVEVCKEKNVYTICRVQEDIEFAPDQVIGRFVFDLGAKYTDFVQMAVNGELNGGTNFFGYQNTPHGFSWYYDDAHEWNPAIITEEIIAAYQTDVIDMFAKDPLRTYTTEQAAPGTY